MQGGIQKYLKHLRAARFIEGLRVRNQCCTRNSGLKVTMFEL